MKTTRHVAPPSIPPAIAVLAHAVGRRDVRRRAAGLDVDQGQLAARRMARSRRTGGDSKLLRLRVRWFHDQPDAFRSSQGAAIGPSSRFVAIAKIADANCPRMAAAPGSGRFSECRADQHRPLMDRWRNENGSTHFRLRASRLGDKVALPDGLKPARSRSTARAAGAECRSPKSAPSAAGEPPLESKKK